MTHPLLRKDFFVETVFEKRFQQMLHDAWDNRSWHLIVADPGAGKTTGIRDLLKTAGGRSVLVVLAPKNNEDEQVGFPSISNDGGKVPSPWWNVLTVEERVRSPQARASSGSHRTSHAKSRPMSLASVGRLREKRTGMWLEARTSESRRACAIGSVWV